MRDVVSTAFRPSEHGFAFPNRWRDTLLGVLSSPGRCGGMIFAALDHFHATEPPPGLADGAPPAYDSALARYVWRRQIASVTTGLGINLWRFVLLTYLPTRARLGAARAARAALPAITRELATGRPVPLGLVASLGMVRMARNHQVLAWAAEIHPSYTLLRVYDPNHPRRDDVTIEVPHDAGSAVVERVGSRTLEWRGLFVERYVPVRVERTAPGPLIERAVSTRPYWIAGVGLMVAYLLLRRICDDRPRRMEVRR